MGRCVRSIGERQARMEIKQMVLAEMLREKNGAPAISHVGQIARLREFRDRLERDCPFRVGDLVTPREDSPFEGAGVPHLVVEVNMIAALRFEGNPSSNAYGRRLDIRFASFLGETIVMHWGESAYLEPYTDAHEKADPERAYEKA